MDFALFALAGLPALVMKQAERPTTSAAVPRCQHERKHGHDSMDLNGLCPVRAERGAARKGKGPEPPTTEAQTRESGIAHTPQNPASPRHASISGAQALAQCISRLLLLLPASMRTPKKNVLLLQARGIKLKFHQVEQQFEKNSRDSPRHYAVRLCANIVNQPVQAF